MPTCCRRLNVAGCKEVTSAITKKLMASPLVVPELNFLDLSWVNSAAPSEVRALSARRPLAVIVDYYETGYHDGHPMDVHGEGGITTERRS